MLWAREIRAGPSPGAKRQGGVCLSQPRRKAVSSKNPGSPRARSLSLGSLTQLVFLSSGKIDLNSYYALCADVAELVDAIDSKSFSSNRVLVRVQSSAKQMVPHREPFFLTDEVNHSVVYGWKRSEGRVRANRLSGYAGKESSHRQNKWFPIGNHFF